MSSTPTLQLKSLERDTLVKRPTIYDIHFPFLGVAQTLHFALKLKPPGRLLRERARAELDEEIISILIFVLYNTRTRYGGAVVGNEFLRGVLGGERKHVFIAGMTLSRFSNRLILLIPA
ncbi:hypothetical protein OPQ81_003982 [Rhizoctonia solani]|nr:hypothetical protein OPQ81_003982 [Rhizoctonia solani]